MTKVPHKDDKVIGANVRRLRMLRGMSQEKLGERLKLTFQQVQKYEKGSNRISGSRLVQIAMALDVPLAELFRGVGPELQGAQAIDDPVLRLAQTAHGVALAEQFTSLPAALQRSVSLLVSDLATTGLAR